MIDVIRLGDFAPLEARTCANKSKLHGSAPIEVADEDRGFDWALAGAAGYRIGNFSLGRNLDGRVGRLVNSQARDVASGAVGEPRLNMESDWLGRLDEDQLGGRDGNLLQQRRLGRIGRRSQGDPGDQDAILRRISAEPPATLMWNSGGGLEQNQTFGRTIFVDAPAEHVARQSAIIPVRVFAAQRKLETVLAVLIAVAH